MNSNVVRTALITGASRGIGYYLSSLFARDQYRLILVSRTRSDLERVKEEFHQRYRCPRIDVYAKDLSQPNSAMELVEEMNTNIDVLVNNAGSGVRGHIWKTKIDDDVATIRLNILSTMELTKLILPTMIERNYGRILMLGSSASFQPNPLLANYAATKAFIASYTDALIDELKETKVTATLLVPGPTDTEFFSRAGANKDFLESMKMLDDPKDVAQRAYQALLNGDHRVYGSAKIQFFVQSSQVLPNELIAKTTRMFMEESESPS